jgi:hypothetical protein
MEGGWKSAGYDNCLTVRKKNLLLLFAPVLYIEKRCFLPRQALDKKVGKVEERRWDGVFAGRSASHLRAAPGARDSTFVTDLAGSL